MRAIYYTAAELAARGSGDIPRELVSSSHLIYSSPATLAFNSPGAEGYGVKRAGLAVPDSVMLIVSPGCCGRNTSAISRMPGYEDRFFYLTMNETDLVTGRHLKKIPKAVAEVCGGLAQRGRRPRVVMICITCVDALLGTDMERICRRAQEQVPGVRVRPCYMYALTREGRRPPMVHVRQSIYALLEPRKKRASSVNLLGFFAPLEGTRSAEKNGFAGCDPAGSVPTGCDPTGCVSAGYIPDSCLSNGLVPAGCVPDSRVPNGGVPESSGAGSELFDLLRQAGVRKVRQIGACADYDEFQSMAEANFNLVLHPDARPAAYDLQERLGIPFIELRRFYQVDRIRAQYAALGKVLQTQFTDGAWEREARSAIGAFRAAYPDAVFSIGEAMNGDPFELACALVREGFSVSEIFGTVNEESFVWIRLLASISPGTRIYSNLHPSMLHYGGTAPAEGRPAASGVEERENTNAHAWRRATITIGRDAGWYHPEIPNVQWNADVQPYGYGAVTGLFRALREAMEAGSRGTHASAVILGEKEEAHGNRLPLESLKERPSVEELAAYAPPAAPPRGFRRHTTPFAPDQSGAVSVLYDMGGICVICDAGGCTGNICGFDEPRWFGIKSAVFSAGLRDMDAILGRDDRLVDKLAQAAGQIPADFAAVIGTPVPAVIGTDYRALCRMAQKRTGLPVLGIATNGMEYYDRGMEKTYLALLETFCSKKSMWKTGAGSVPGNPSIPAPDPVTDSALQGAPLADAEPRSDSIAVGTKRMQVLRAPDKEKGISHPGPAEKSIGIWGYSPLDFAGILTEEALGAWAAGQGYERMICCGAGTRAEALGRLADVERNIVLSPAGAGAAGWLEIEFGTPWEYAVPGLDSLLERLAVQGGHLLSAWEKPPAKQEGQPLSAGEMPPKVQGGNALSAGRKVLVVHQQVLARCIADALQERGMQADAATFFMMNRELCREGDVLLREEWDLRILVCERRYDTVLADRALAPVLAGLPVTLVHLPHFAVSGKME